MDANPGSSEPPGSSQLKENATYSNSPRPDLTEGPVYHHAFGAVLWAMAFNMTIATLKLVVALNFTRSAALFSEGLHSLGDAINSVTLLFGITRGKRLPDRTHPFGYGLEANFWALLASFVLFVGSLWAIYEGIQRFYHPVGFEDLFWAIVILAISIVLEIFAVWTASRAVLEEVGVEVDGFFAKIPKAFVHVKNVVGPTTRFVFYEDTLAFLGAVVALSAILIGKYSVEFGILAPEYAHYPDAIASILIGFMILGLSVNLFRYNRGFLTGAAAPVSVEKKIESLALGVYGVSRVHDIKTIDQGLSGLIVHMTVEVEPDTPVKDVDDLTERIKEKLTDQIPSVWEEQVFIEVLADESEEQWGETFSLLIDEGRAKGVLKPRDEALLRKAYDFTELVLRDVMIPRTDVTYVDAETSLEEVLDLMIETGHSRFPVYKEHVDNMIGLIHSRDIMQQARSGNLDISLEELIRELDIFPETKPVSDLLEVFKRDKVRMAAVADEHGGFAGLVTVEDLLEEIVGEIWDEHDEEESMIEFLTPQSILVSGKYNIWDLNERLDLNFPTDEYVTVGGFVFGTLGREPEQGDTIPFEDLVLTVAKSEGPRITTVMIESPTPFEETKPVEIASADEAQPLPSSETK